LTGNPHATATIAIDAADLAYCYPGRTEPAVRGITFRVERGEVFGFLGPSGAGKSTTQKVLIGLLRDFSGGVEILGRRLPDWGRDLYRRIGVSFELPSHYHKLTAVENLRLFADLYGGAERDPLDLLARLGLEGDAGVRAGQFSKGMLMRLNVARALLHRPEIVFLDEPTAGMDPANARRVKELIREERGEGRTVFLTTHDMTVADELCDRVAFLAGGRIAALDSPRNLKLRHGRRVLRVEVRRDGRLAAREFPIEGLAADDGFRALLDGGDDIETVHTQEATLEDIFLDVTGQALL